MESLKIILIAVVFTLSGCGSGIYSKTQPATSSVLGQKIRGQVFDFETEQMMDLKSLNDRPVVIMFAGDTCLDCANEAQAIKKVLAAGDTPLKHENLLTVLNGAHVGDARRWKKALRIDWKVVMDTDLSAYHELCPGATQVPCTVISRPDSGFVYEHVGITTADTILSSLFPALFPTLMPSESL